MKYAYRIGTGFIWPNELVNLGELDSWPVISHTYGLAMPRLPDEPCFMQYSPSKELSYMPAGVSSIENTPFGSIQFSRSTYKFFPKLCERVIEFLGSLSSGGYTFDPSFVHIMRTRGSIPLHRDENGRKAAINIGVQNASSARTIYSLDNTFRNFTSLQAEITCQDGSAYLLDTYNPHAVIGRPDVMRTMITYGVPESFSELTPHFQER